MKIISIDPGYERVGIAIIEKNEGEKENLLFSTCFKTSPKTKLSERILNIGQEIKRLIKEYKPEAMAIESLFMTTNQKTVMGVSEARGVIIYEGSVAMLPIFEYTPLQIKIAVTGYGRASKNDVMAMIPKLIVGRVSMDGTRHDFAKSDDELDAIAVGLTCLAHEKFKK